MSVDTIGIYVNQPAVWDDPDERYQQGVISPFKRLYLQNEPVPESSLYVISLEVLFEEVGRS